MPSIWIRFHIVNLQVHILCIIKWSYLIYHLSKNCLDTSSQYSVVYEISHFSDLLLPNLQTMTGCFLHQSLLFHQIQKVEPLLYFFGYTCLPFTTLDRPEGILRIEALSQYGPQIISDVFFGEICRASSITYSQLGTISAFAVFEGASSGIWKIQVAEELTIGKIRLSISHLISVKSTKREFRIVQPPRERSAIDPSTKSLSILLPCAPKRPNILSARSRRLPPDRCRAVFFTTT